VGDEALHRLIAIAPDGAERVFPLPPDATRLLIGRAPDSDLVIDWDPQVSRAHAQVERMGGAWAVLDDGISRYGTLLNGARLAGRRRLADGDVLRMGRTDLLYRAPAIEMATTVRPAGGTPVELTAAQRKVLVALARPYGAGGFPTPASNQDIAAELHVSLEAVKGHLRALFGKFAIGDLPQNQKRARLVERALERGVISRHELR
jgi:pSer/pThr/pTyr-binding forkhead associated (FHA) protein